MLAFRALGSGSSGLGFSFLGVLGLQGLEV